MLRIRTLTTATIVLLAACNDTPTTPSGVEGYAAAKPGGRTDPTATWKIPLADAGLGFASDGQYGDGTYSVYADGVCGVSAKIFATTAASNSGDATIQTAKAKNCTRRFTLHYPDAFTETVPSFNNLLQLQSSTYLIPVNTTVKRRLIISPGAVANNPSRCGRLLFGPNGTVSVGSDSVDVTRTSASTWLVQSGASNLAYCEANGQLYAMPVNFVVVSSSPLP